MTLLKSDWRPMKHQAEDVDRLSAFTRINVWNGLGTGKTATIAWWLQRLWLAGQIDEAIIVLPSMTLPDWMSTLCGAAWPDGLVKFYDCRPPDADMIRETLTSGLRPEQGRFTVMATTFSGLRNLLAEKSRGRNFVKAEHPMMIGARGRRTALVVDEAQSVALPTSAQGVAARSLGSACRAVAAVTATPIGRPEHLRLWGLAKLVRPDVVARFQPDIIRAGNRVYPSGAPGSFEAFKYRYGHLVDPMEKKGKLFSVQRAFVVGVHSDLIQREVLDPMVPYTVRRRKEDCLDLPDKIYMRRSYQLSAEAHRLMVGLVEDDRAVLEDGHAVVPENILIEKLRTLELTGGYLEGRPVHDGKLLLLKDVMAEIDENVGERTPRHVWASRSREVIACALVCAGAEPRDALRIGAEVFPGDAETESSTRYSEVVDRCRRARVGIIHGPTSERSRDEIQSAWRSGEIRTVIAHPGVAGAGLNWQHSKSAVYYSQPLGTIARSQSEDRVHRHGLKHLAIIYDLITENGPDEAVVEAHRGQRSAAGAMLDWMTELIYG